jgi:hypothetical protein
MFLARMPRSIAAVVILSSSSVSPSISRKRISSG